MRNIMKLSSAMRVIGVVLISLVLVLLLYSTATDGSDWLAFSTKLKNVGIQPGLADRFSFNSAYFQALGKARANHGKPSTARAQEVAEIFDSFRKRAETVELAEINAVAAENEEFFASQFDYQNFLALYHQREGGNEQAEIRELVEYLDNLSVPALKSGKVLPNLRPASIQPWLEEKHSQWQAAHGEQSGSFLEYLRTITRLVKQDAAIKNARDFANALAFEDYLSALEETRAEEQGTQAAHFLDEFAAMAQDKVDGKAVSIPEFLKAGFEKTTSRLADSSTKTSYALFTGVVRGYLENNLPFDGSYSMLADSMRQAQAEVDGLLFETWLKDFSQGILKSSDSRRMVPLNALVWQLASRALWFLAAGIFLIAASFLIARLAVASIIKRSVYSAAPDDPDVLLRVKNLSQYFKSGSFVNKAVDNISFHIKKGEVFGLVGESGCGKTTSGRDIINLYDPTGGDVYFRGLRISSTKNGAPIMRYQLGKELDENLKSIDADCRERKNREPERSGEIERECAGKKSALRKQHAEALERVQAHAFESEIEKGKCVMLYREQRKAELTEQYNRDMQGLSGEQAEKRTRRYKAEMKAAARDNVMARIQMIFQDPIASINPRMTVREIIAEGLRIRGIRDKELINNKVHEMLDLVGLVQEHADRYPHEFSGGQRQRIGIARALVLEPDLIIADEPISALDVSIQAQVINLLNDLRRQRGLTILFIAHNLSVVKYFSDRIAVMYYGRIVEMADSDELFLHPLHPYTKSLLSAIPYPDPHYEKQRVRLMYEPVLAHDYSVDKPQLQEISPGHFILCNQAELEQYRKELGL